MKNKYKKSKDFTKKMYSSYKILRSLKSNLTFRKIKSDTQKKPKKISRFRTEKKLKNYRAYSQMNMWENQIFTVPTSNQSRNNITIPDTWTHHQIWSTACSLKTQVITPSKEVCTKQMKYRCRWWWWSCLMS